jgi:hypothetical protein
VIYDAKGVPLSDALPSDSRFREDSKALFEGNTELA